jgi:integrating conjugative element protein (TIGR03749 family)
VGAILLLMQVLAIADAGLPERITWGRTPIEVLLPVDQERLVRFPGAVKVGLPGRLQPLLRAQSVDGTLYLLAHEPFEPTRVMVREIASGRVYLLDIAASKEEGSTNPIEVVLPTAKREVRDDGAPETGEVSTPPAYGYVALTRFAAQQLYAPARLLQDRPGIVRVPIRRDSILLVRGSNIEATPLVAWRANGLYLTAVKLTNRTNQPQVLDPRDLRGVWLTATFQHNRLLSVGNEADTTAVYLISARPFAVAR